MFKLVLNFCKGSRDTKRSNNAMNSNAEATDDLEA